MNRLLKTILVGALFSSGLMADFTRVEMGAGVWSSEPTGTASYTANGVTAYDIATQKKETNPYIWVLIKHPVPVVPNLRLEYTDVSTKGIANGTFEDFIATNGQTQLSLKQYDIIPYYNILDNTGFVTLDLGLDIKLIDASYQANGVTPLVGGGTTYSENMLLPIPLVYTRLRFEIPATDIGLETDAKYISYSDSTVYDIRVKVDYTLDFIPVLQPAIEVGYRKQKYDINENDLSGKINLEFSGFYAGAMIRF